jgi:hypothetical protein
VLLLLVLGPLPARADVLQDLGATFQAVAAELAAAFPKVEVRITAVDGETLQVGGPGAARLRPGLELSVFRRGEPFRHPITNQLLGHAEQDLGILVVASVQGETARGRFVPQPGRPAPDPGDGARITAGRLPVAVLPTSGVNVPFESVDQAQLLLVARFSALLDKTGRFLALDPRRVLGALGNAEEATPAPVELARHLGVPAILTSRLVREGSGRVLETAWISGHTGATLVTLRTPMVTAAYPPRFAWEETPELARQYALDAAVRGLGLGDLDGDGRQELVVADEQAVTVERATEGGALAPVEGAVYRPGGLILAVDAAPLRGTARAQVVVAEVRPDEGRGGVRARVLEWSPGGFETLYETSGRYLRVVRVDGEPWLLEQDAGETEPFEPAVRRLVWDGTRFRDGATIRVPRGVSIFGLALMRLTGSAEPDVVALTTEDRLSVWTARGQRLWTSADPLGGSAITFPYGPTGGRSPAAQDAGVFRVPGRVIPLAGTAGPEILVYENLLPGIETGRGLLPRLAATVFNRGRVHRLRWREGAFGRVWQSGMTTGYIADLAYGDLDGDGIPEVLVGVVPRGLDLDTLNPFGRGRGRVVAYELP